MEALVISGGKSLCGEVTISGAKNAVLPILAATVIHGGRYRIGNCPDITDVDRALEIIASLGGSASRQGKLLLVDTTGICRWQIPAYLMMKMRASILFLGALLARFGKAEMTLPGGCPLGRRPIDLHLQALAQMGAEVTLAEQQIHCRTNCFHGGTITLPFPSVGATENVLLAAVACRGAVCLTGGAREPEIEDLIRFLCAMGADIKGEKGEWIVHGGNTLHDTDHRVLPDRIETATYLCAAAGCGGRIRLKHTDGTLLLPVVEVLKDAGCEIRCSDHEISLQAPQRLRAPGCVTTAPYPGFPTDAQALLMAALLRMEGSCCLTEGIFENRFSHVRQMQRLGGDIQIKGCTACLRGVPVLRGAVVEGCDLRAAAALIIAAMQAEGKSTVFGLKHLDRGYDNMEQNLRRLGADVVRCGLSGPCNNSTGNFCCYGV